MWGLFDSDYPQTTFRTLREDLRLKGLVDSIAGACRLARKEGLIFFESRDLVVGKDDDIKVRASVASSGGWVTRDLRVAFRWQNASTSLRSLRSEPIQVRMPVYSPDAPCYL